MKRLIIAIGISSLVCISLISNDLTAQEDGEGTWTTHTTSDGLPYPSVTAIAIGPHGEIWCVPYVEETGGGIAHFDGNMWKHYTTKDGLGSDAVLWTEHTLAVSSDGVVWVATFGGGVSRFDGESWKTYSKKDGLFADNVSGVAIAPNGDVWCTHSASPDCGISHFNGESWTGLTPSDMGITSCNLMNIAFDPDGTLWASGGDAVLRFDGETWKSFGSESGLEIPVALYMDIGPDGKVWVVGGGGVSCYDGSIWKHFSMAEIGTTGSSIIPLAADHENVVWLGVMDDGVFRYDGTSWEKFAPDDAPALNNVFSITVGPDGSLWFGTYQSGILCYHSSQSGTSDDKATIPGKYALLPNYPNPFNPMTTIIYDLPISTHVQMTIYDILNRQVKQIVDTQKPAGQHKVTWDATNDHGELVAAGLYFCRMEAEDFVNVIKLALVK